ncbi:EGF-like repeat and discoidin I-like domain-containing protein 3 [Nematostella vectensis]|uniref:EGF-like repeat and discoidin I-like domain-containing protein 3 n=1 Tax=Nematostella vectensis TaxID=45351 RepID=UPI0020776608|nr:EGF-like repeat and discoidin I-like domain-containing protein 3 [Nematostella vectensis]
MSSSFDRPLVPAFLFLLLLIIRRSSVSGSQCHTSSPGMSLIGYDVISFSNMDLNSCWQHCRASIQCQSLNYFIRERKCVVNNRTIEQRPRDVGNDDNAMYFDNPYKAVIGSSPNLPALSCNEIRNTSSSAISGLHWLRHEQSGAEIQVFCNMSTGLIESCQEDQCKNNGTCQYLGNGNYTCECLEGFNGNNCEKGCGSHSRGLQSSIPNNSFTSSSAYSSCDPFKARIDNTSGYWAPATTTDPGDYLQIDLGPSHVICAVETQGGQHSGEWTTKYKLKHSMDGMNWTTYQEVFKGNTDDSTKEKRFITEPFSCRFLRFVPTTYRSWKALRVEVYGYTS